MGGSSASGAGLRAPEEPMADGFAKRRGDILTISS